MSSPREVLELPTCLSSRMIPNTAFSPSVSLVHKWANAVAAEMRALHWEAERVFLMLSLAVVPFMPPSWPARTSWNEREGGGRYEV